MDERLRKELQRSGMTLDDALFVEKLKSMLNEHDIPKLVPMLHRAGLRGLFLRQGYGRVTYFSARGSRVDGSVVVECQLSGDGRIRSFSEVPA